MSLELFPVTLRQARDFVNKYHRHHRAPQGGLFAVGLVTTDESESVNGLVGVAIVGRPVARHIASDPRVAEVTRLCTDGSWCACSKLYAACWRAARALGYSRLITYTLATEGGGSLRGAGWKCLGQTGGGSWSRSSRPRIDSHPTEPKLKWKIS